uniref:Uncharacterized protein n=1 Tax=Panagrolaimus sp. JU765 TaxID=591449 RepID=A0AC34PUC3_9BILA
MEMFITNDVCEPHVWNNSMDKPVLLGFASHQNKFTTSEMNATELFVMRCPKKCSNDDRQWICTICGEFFKADSFDVKCGCGNSHAFELNYECFDPKHVKTFSFWEIGDFPTVENVVEPLNFTDEQNTMLGTIKQQLEKIVKKNYSKTNGKINAIIQSIEAEDDSLIDQLKSLEMDDLDGETAGLLKDFLNSQQ